MGTAQEAGVYVHHKGPGQVEELQAWPWAEQGRPSLLTASMGCYDKAPRLASWTPGGHIWKMQSPWLHLQPPLLFFPSVF